jgi:hypothetical protein
MEECKDLKNDNTFIPVFWNALGGLVTFRPDPAFAAIMVSVDDGVAIIYKLQSGQITFSNPSQNLATIHVTVSSGPGTHLPLWRGSLTQTLTYNLPQGGQAEGSVTKTTQA